MPVIGLIILIMIAVALFHHVIIPLMIGGFVIWAVLSFFGFAFKEMIFGDGDQNAGAAQGSNSEHHSQQNQNSDDIWLRAS